MYPLSLVTVLVWPWYFVCVFMYHFHQRLFTRVEELCHHQSTLSLSVTHCCWILIFRQPRSLIDTQECQQISLSPGDERTAPPVCDNANNVCWAHLGTSTIPAAHTFFSEIGLFDISVDNLRIFSTLPFSSSICLSLQMIYCSSYLIPPSWYTLMASILAVGFITICC